MSPKQDDVIETFRLPEELSRRLSITSNRYDLSKSQIIRTALEEHLRTLELLESVVQDAVLASMVRNSTKNKS